jgi:hypothetical protein
MADGGTSFQRIVDKLVRAARVFPLPTRILLWLYVRISAYFPRLERYEYLAGRGLADLQDSIEGAIDECHVNHDHPVRASGQRASCDT